MPAVAPPLTYRVTAQSRDALRAARRLAEDRSQLSYVDSTGIGYTFDRGTPIESSRESRIGDYFDEVEISEGPNDEPFNIMFHIRDSVDGYWKDMIMHLVLDLERMGVAVDLIRKPRP